MRIVDLPKAVTAGVAGALAMELVAYAIRMAGLAAVDLAVQLGSVLVPLDHGVGRAGGLLAHAAVGIAWALFYAYFFWGRLKWPQLLQGLAFSMIPAFLAVLFVYPQLHLMQAHSDVVRLTLSDHPVVLVIPRE